MSRELLATLISAAMIAAVFLVVSRTDQRSDPQSGEVRLFGVELARDASREDVFEVADRLDAGVKIAVMQELGLSEAELVAERDRIIEREITLEHSDAEREIQRFVRAVAYLEPAVAQMPDSIVSAYDAQSEFIAGLNLPEDVDDSAFRNLLSARPEQRAGLVTIFERQAKRPVEEWIDELRASLLPIAETQALRSMICDRAEAFEPDGSGTDTVNQGLFGASRACSVFAMRYADRLLSEDLPDDAALRARVLSVLSLGRVL